ncbi:hypothetical protein OS493_011377 [Desmophyllum pertusum]|uniref:Uncharacterized protein n=1 Tax=Desmophyllum pertusum TaxID=174260 RepID=A0A9X0CTM7_9CNID|nr:hypothetical protein OS493_011377 [Desmophyllum pertusum]
MAWCTTSATSSYSLVVFLVLVGLILGSTSEPIEPQREPWLGSLDCPPSLTVQWNEILVRPPYVVKVIQYPTDDFDSTKQNSTDDFDSTKQNSTYDFDGLFPTILEMMLNECCRLSSNVVYLNSSDVEPDFNLPVIVNLEAVKYNINRQRNLTLVSMLPQTGTAFVVVKANKSDQLWQVMKSLFSTWPVLVLTLILSLLAGIIAWSLVG